MSLDYEKKYAYTEAYEIIKWLGKEYEEKLPRKVFEGIKLERRLDYKPQIDFFASVCYTDKELMIEVKGDVS